MITTPTTTIAIARAAIAGKKYVSTMEAGSAVGSGVAGGGLVTLTTVSACEPQYELEPE